MGTSGSYSGSGGKHGDSLRGDIGSWLDSLPSSRPKKRPPLNPESLLNAIPLLRPRAGGSGGGGAGGISGDGGRGEGGGGPRRSVGRLAATAGRAAASAYAFRSGDVAGLERFGLVYEELSRLDPLELTIRIVNAACGPRSNSTIEDHEQQYVAAEVAEFVLERNEGGAPPSPEEVARQAIAVIIAEVVDSEIGELLRDDDRPAWAEELAEAEIREAAEVLAGKAELSVTGATDEEFSRAIEDGIETLRRIVGVSA
jgi:hypothetical protein